MHHSTTTVTPLLSSNAPYFQAFSAAFAFCDLSRINDQQFAEMLIRFKQENSSLNWVDVRRILIQHFFERWNRFPFLARRVMGRVDRVIEHPRLDYQALYFQSASEARFFMGFFQLVLPIQLTSEIIVDGFLNCTYFCNVPLSALKNINSYLASADTYLKVVNWEEGFIRQCLSGLIQIPGEYQPMPFRIGDHALYSVFESGVYDSDQTRNRYSSAQLSAFLQSKEGSSKHQSVSLYIPENPTDLYLRSGKLRKTVALTFNPAQYPVNRCLVKAGGTIDRNCEENTIEKARARHAELKGNLFDQCDVSFRNAIKNKRSSYPNEVMPYLCWIVETSGIVAAKDDFETLCIAYHYAYLVECYLKRWADHFGLVFTEKPEIPVGTYIKKRSRLFSSFTRQQKMETYKKALTIFLDPGLFSSKMASNDIEFLLLLSRPYCNQALQKKYKGIQLIFYLVYQGHFEIADTIYEKTDMAFQKTFAQYLADSITYSERHYLTIPHLYSNTLALFKAIKLNRLDLFPVLKCQLEWIDAKCTRPIHLAANFGRLDFVKLLLREGANPTFKNNMKQTAFMIAASNGSSEILQVLLPYYTKEEWISALDLAISKFRLNTVIQFLLNFMAFGTDAHVDGMKKCFEFFQTLSIDRIQRALKNQKPHFDALQGMHATTAKEFCFFLASLGMMDWVYDWMQQGRFSYYAVDDWDNTILHYLIGSTLLTVPFKTCEAMDPQFFTKWSKVFSYLMDVKNTTVDQRDPFDIALDRCSTYEVYALLCMVPEKYKDRMMVIRNNTDFMRYLLKEKSGLLRCVLFFNCVHPDNQSLAQIKQIIAVISAEIKADERDASGRTCLMYAAENGAPQTILYELIQWMKALPNSFQLIQEAAHSAKNVEHKIYLYTAASAPSSTGMFSNHSVHVKTNQQNVMKNGMIHFF